MLTLLINHNYISDVTSFVTSNKSFSIQEIQLLHTNQFKEMECKLGIYTLSDGEELGSFTGILQQGDLYFDVYKGTYSGRYPFSIPVIPVHFFVSKDRYLLRS